MKALLAGAMSAIILAACGGGGDGPAKATPVMSIAYYGAPMPQAGAAVSKVAIARAASDATTDPSAAATVSALTQALAAQGVTASVTPVTMTATALHELVMSVNGGVRPTNDQLTVQPTGYAVVNFQLDDMVTSRDDPAQTAALEQFQSDLQTFILQQALAARLTFVLKPIPTCDLPVGHSAADGLIQAEGSATSAAFSFLVGDVPATYEADGKGGLVNTSLTGHMGADCRTPDASIVDGWTQTAAARMAINFKGNFPD